MASLDFSSEKPGDDKDNALRSSHDLQSLVDKTSLGTKDKDGMYEVKDWEFSKKQNDADDDIIARALSKTSLSKDSEASSGEGGSKLPGALGNIFARLTGNKVLSEEDLKPVLDAMKQHLMKKNVARDVAEKVCEGVGEGLVGRKVGGWQSKLQFIYYTSMDSDCVYYRVFSYKCSIPHLPLILHNPDPDPKNINRSPLIHSYQTVFPAPKHPPEDAV